MKNMSLKNEKILLLIWLVVNVCVGILVVHDFGIGTDEPIYKLYAQESLDAYKSFFGLLHEPTFEIKNLRFYGPSFVVIVSLVARFLLKIMPNILAIDIWHFSYFVLFQSTGLCLYAMTKRWFSRWAAWGTLVLFITQPLIWGHSFINPKDIPFMFFFTCSVYLGFRLADTFETESPVISLRKPSQNLYKKWSQVDLQKRKKIITVLKIEATLFLLFLILSTFFNRIIENTVIFFYSADLNTWAGEIFLKFAEQATFVPAEDYVLKAQKLFLRFEYGLLILSLLVIMSYFGFLLAKASKNLNSLDSKKTKDKYGFLRMVQNYRISLKNGINRHSFKRFVRDVFTEALSWKVALAGIFLGYTVSTRVLGPLAGLIVITYLVLKARQKSFSVGLAYLFWASITTYLAWPYLWAAPIAHYFESLEMMSNFPWGGRILFDGQFYRAYNLPSEYLPVLLNIQLTEPFLGLFYIGFGLLIWRLFKTKIRVDFLLFFLFGFVIIIAALIVMNSPLYDNFRQLLFILPAMFVIAGLSFDAIFTKIKRNWIRVVLIIALAIPGIYAGLQLHPYEYIYYNSFVGGTGGAFRRFEMDYWRISYRELALEVNQIADNGATVGIVGDSTFLPYARTDLIIIRNKDAKLDISGGYAVLTSRWNSDTLYPDAQTIKSIERDGAIFAVLKYIEEPFP